MTAHSLHDADLADDDSRLRGHLVTALTNLATLTTLCAVAGHIVWRLNDRRP